MTTLELHPDDRELLHELGRALTELRDDVAELRAALRRLRNGELVAHLTEAEREELSYRVAERIDERLANSTPIADGQRGRN